MISGFLDSTLCCNDQNRMYPTERSSYKPSWYLWNWEYAYLH